MKTPKVPKPIPATTPTAPVLGMSGATDAAQQMKQKYGFMSTFMAANTSGNAHRLSQYLGGTPAKTKVEVLATPGKKTPGASIHR